MNLKNKKGYVITDVSISIIILLVLLPVIMGIIYGIEASKLATETKSEAINIAVNTVEAAKGLEIRSVNPTAVLNNIVSCYNSDGNSIDVNGSTATINTKKASYKVIVSVDDYHSTNNSAPENVVKTVKATVQYMTRGEINDLELSTVIK